MQAASTRTTTTRSRTMPDSRPGEGSRLQDVIRRLHEARTKAPRGSDASWPGPVADSGAPGGDGGTATDRPETGELFWRPFNPKSLERTRPFRTAPPSRDEFESHLSQFLGTRARRTSPLFRAQGVTVRYGAVAACTDVDLELNDGEIVAVIGPHGAGKTAPCDALRRFGPPPAWPSSTSRPPGSRSLSGRISPSGSACCATRWASPCS